MTNDVFLSSRPVQVFLQVHLSAHASRTGQGGAAETPFGVTSWGLPTVLLSLWHHHLANGLKKRKMGGTPRGSGLFRPSSSISAYSVASART